jgi:HlyD family secretion protein
MKKRLGWIITALILAGVAIFVWRWRATHKEPDVTFKTTPLEKKRITARVTASGTLQATVTVLVGAQVSGRIAKLYADYNATVHKGQLVAKIDPQLFQAAVEQANANYVSAKANVAKAEAQLRDAELQEKRVKSLFDQTLASAADLQTAETNLAVARAGVDVQKADLEQAQASLHQTQVNLSYTSIFSPIDGTVISRSVDVGQTVAASLSAPTLFTIAEDLRKMQVHTNVAEGDVGRLAADQEASFTVDAFLGQRFRGKISQIRNAAQTLQNVVTYDAVIDVDNGDLRLRPGMTATVTVVYAERPDALAVPNAALRFRPGPDVLPATSANASSEAHDAGAAPGHGPQPTVRRTRPAANNESSDNEPRSFWVLRAGKPEQVSVVAGLSDGTVTEVVSGDAHPGDLAILDAIVAGKSQAASNQGGAGGAGGGPPRMGRMF